MKGTIAILTTLIAATGYARLVEKVIEYRDGDTVCEGFLVYDDTLVRGKAPGVMIVHQWMGLTDYEKMRARKLAELGYVAFACDIYGKGVRPANANEAGGQAMKYKTDAKLFRSRLNAGLSTLTSQAVVDSNKMGAIGYCFGGTGVLELARSGANVRAVVSFHGGLSSPMPATAPGVVKSSVLVCHGAVDPLVSSAEIAGFQKEMADAKVDYVFCAYAGAKHSFTDKNAGNNPGSPVAYDEKADNRSWQAMKEFFAEAFKK